MTPEWVEIAKLFFAFITSAFGAYLTYLIARLNKIQVMAAGKVDEAATKVEEVRTVLQTATAKTDNKLNEVHALVNGAMGAQLSLTAQLARRLANETKHADDAKAADMAEEALAQHEKTTQRSEHGPK